MAGQWAQAPRPPSVLLHYDGNSWKNVDNPTSWTLSDIDMTSADSGWAIGASSILYFDGTVWHEYSGISGTQAQAISMLNANTGRIGARIDGHPTILELIHIEVYLPDIQQ